MIIIYFVLAYTFSASLNAIADPDITETSCVCGNGIQEPFPPEVVSCPYRLYGATAPAVGAASDLVYLNPYDGTGVVIATMTGIKDVTGLDFSPSGKLYAVGRNASNQSILATIDCQTGVATPIGLTGAPSILSAINFDSQGRLWTHMNTVTSRTRLDGFLGRLDIGTGAYTDVGPTGLSQIGNGIGFHSFPVESLFHAGGRYLSVLNQVTGSASVLHNLLFFAPTHNHPRINDMDLDPYTNKLYISIADNGFGINAPHENYLGTMDLNTGAANFVKIPAKFAPVGLSAITFNRAYETCDQGATPANELPLPNGTACSLTSCALTETTCTDGEDNDFDGLRDCADSDCEGLLCIFSDGCSIDMCRDGICVEGEPLVCDDGDDCTSDSCIQGSCVNEIDTGNFCTDFNSCTEDTCSLAGVCESVTLADETPCDDESPCTIADACFGGQCIGSRAAEICDNGIDDNCDELIDGEDPECAGPVTIEDICDDQEDNDGDFLFDCEDPDCDGLVCQDEGNTCSDDICTFGICEHFPNDLNSCSDDNVCTDDSCNDGVCVGTANTAFCNDNDPCTLEDSCVDGSCSGTQMICDDDNPCTTDFCADGFCGVDPLSGTPCESDNMPCTDDVCQNGECMHVNDNTNPCNDGLACSSGDHCVSGQCTGTRGSETGANCSNGIDDDCDFLIDDLDPNCSSGWLRVFVTRNIYSPNFGSAQAADAICQAAAASASRMGTFKALVSSSTSDAASRILNPHNRPWYLFTTLPSRIADNKTDLFDSTILAAINVDEFGVDASGNPKFVWTGSLPNGTYSADNTCNDWTTTKANVKGTRGATDKIDDKWINQPDATCNQEYRLYCFQIDTAP